MMCHCGIKRHALSRAYLVKASIDIILITRSQIRDPVFPMTVPSHNSNPSIKYFDWVEEPTYGTDGITAENESNVKWSDANDEVYPDRFKTDGSVSFLVNPRFYRQRSKEKNAVKMRYFKVLLSI